MKENNQVILYKSAEGKIKLDVRLQDDSVWINRHQMSILFDRQRY